MIKYFTKCPRSTQLLLHLRIVDVLDQSLNRGKPMDEYNFWDQNHKTFLSLQCCHHDFNERLDALLFI